MKKVTTFLYTVFLIMVPFSISAQNKNSAIADSANLHDKLLNFAENINKFNHFYPQEKVYLHFDNTAYRLGETIRFKAYIVTAENNSLSNLSKVLYAEILSPYGDIMETKKYKIEDGTAHGDFILRDSLYAGYYEIRAYTRCMFNFGPETVFSRVFPVLDDPDVPGDYSSKRMTVRHESIEVPSVREKMSKRNNLTIEFFPEGGNLIAGINNRVAFKATNKHGQNMDVSGTIHDDSGNEITSFHTIHSGMGSFDFIPRKENRKYYAKTDFEGKELKINLPPIFPSGYVIRVNNLQSSRMVIQVEKTFDAMIRELGLSISCRGKVYAFDTFTVDECGRHTIQISKRNLPVGVMHIVLFTSAGDVLAERLAFVNGKEEGISVKTKITPQIFEPHGAIELDIETTDMSGNPAAVDFSLSVRDKSAMVETYHTDNIYTNLLLSSDLKGYIENPAYYFEVDDNKHRLSLDLLMMVQGWRRYNWRQMAGVEPFEVKYGIEHGLIVEGRVMSGKKPQENIDVKMWMTNPDTGMSRHGLCVTDEYGRFNFEVEDIYGRWNMNLHTAKDGKRKFFNTLVDRNVDLPAKHFAFYESMLPEIQAGGDSQKKQQEFFRKVKEPKHKTPENEDVVVAAKDSIKAFMLDEVTVTEKKKRKEKEFLNDYARQNGNTKYDVELEIDRLIDTQSEYLGYTLEEFLLNTNDHFYEASSAPGGEDSHPILLYKDKRVSFYYNNLNKEDYMGRDIIVDDIKTVIITEKDPLPPMLSPESKPPYEYMAVFVYLKDNWTEKRTRGIRKTYVEGYTLPQEYYNPDYTYGVLPGTTDYRRTLYWNPNVKTDSSGKISILLFNNGVCKELDINAEGLTKEGAFIINNK